MTKIEGFLLEIHGYQKGKHYKGEKILSSNVVNALEKEGYCYWLVDDIKLNPSTQYRIWIDEDQRLYGFAKSLQNAFFIKEV